MQIRYLVAGHIDVDRRLDKKELYFAFRFLTHFFRLYQVRGSMHIRKAWGR